MFDEPHELAVTHREVLATGRIQAFVRETVQYNGAPMTREFFEHPGAVAILAVDDENRVLTIKQYRHPIRSRDWEIPAGLLDIAGEPLLLAAQRELAEEADLVASTWHILADINLSPGGSNEFARIYLARGLSAADTVFAREEEEADIELRWVALDEIVAAVLAGDVRNSLLMIGALAASASDWSTLRDA